MKETRRVTRALMADVIDIDDDATKKDFLTSTQDENVFSIALASLLPF